MFSICNLMKALCLVCLVALCQTSLAQTEDTVAVDTVVQPQPQPRRTARTPKLFIIGSIRSNTVLHRMPQYKAMKSNMESLRLQYEAEARKSEEDFQRKFEEFMHGQNEFPKTILEKRQNELQNMLETNAEFRIKVQKLLQEAEKTLMDDVRAEMSDAINIVSKERGINIVFDLDGGSVPYVVDGLTTDITQDVIRQLGLSDAEE